MNQFRIFLIFSVIIVFFSCVKNKETKIPEWVYTPPQSEDTLYSVGIGDGKTEALISALTEMSGNIFTTVTSKIDSIADSINEPLEFISPVNIIKTSRSFGKVIIFHSSMTLHADSSDGTGYFESVGLLTYFNGDKQMTVKLFRSEDPINYYLEIFSNNCVLSDIIQELESYGFTFRSYADCENYFLLASCSKEKIFKEVEIESLPEDTTLNLHEHEKSDKLFKEFEKQIRELPNDSTNLSFDDLEKEIEKLGK